MATITAGGPLVIVRDQTNLLPRTQLLVVFSTLATAFLIAYADQNGVGVALPTIARDLNARDTISWAGTSSMIANTVFQVLYGRLSDIFGRKKVYLSAVLLLAIADILCATAQTAWAFYLFRGMAGVATGGINSLTMMIVSDIVTLQERGRYQGILGSCIGLGNTIGNGLAKAKLIDIWGLLSGSIAIICTLIPISGGGSYFPWNSTLVIAMLSVGGVATIAFILVEWKVAKLPMVPLSMFRTPAVTVILLQNLFFGYCYYAELYFLPLYFENVRGVTPLVSAALLVPLVVAQMIFSVGSGFYISHYSRYGEVIWFGFICWTAGASVLCTLKQDTSLGVIIVALIILGVGVGNVFQPCLIAIQAHSPKDLRAVIISNRNFFRALGGAIGLACSSLVLQASFGKALPDDLRYLSRDSYVLPTLSDFSTADQNALRAAYSQASRTVFISMAPVMGFCLMICVFIRDKGLQRKEEIAPPQPVLTTAGSTFQEPTGMAINAEK
ncbi:uncharacterized protein N7498_003608 [Penicillium cinerascens]|uniref:Major facilitator superfamily (MFS) profile domain-containing protein n=1 Tax=Penicillium cinerascens TaxID=70096 RepID=A0A9W9N2H0_9EURO|nr:uncharacterized protein N7498_003608 [Penicillium cinerascens]KAJ5211962.1 hypothetical protein N7498_003608 [Penicillium cinerascens]